MTIHRVHYLYSLPLREKTSRIDLQVNRGGGRGSIRGLLNLLFQSGGRRRSGSDSQNIDREGADDIEVDESAATVLGKTKVEEQDGLEEPVEGDPVEDGIAPELDNREGSVDDPVGEEVGVVGCALGLKGLEGVVARDNQRGKVGEKLANSAQVQEHEESVEDSQSNDTVRLGNTGLGLKLLEDGEFFKLLYK